MSPTLDCVRVAMASSGGHLGRPNEDFVGAVAGAVVLLDGAGIPGTEAICRHGTAWHSHTLGATLLERLSLTPGIGLADVLAESIDEVARRHRDTCDVANPMSPQSTVAIVRLGEGRLDHLVLGDCFVVLDLLGSEPQVVTDPREVRVREECTAVLRGLAEGTPEWEREYAAARDALRARRNRPGGFWLAKDDPAAAAESVVGSVPASAVRGAALLSNGASRVVEPYGLLSWTGVLEVMRRDGPEEVLRLVRWAESGGGVEADDATAAHASLL